jgi:hypothetical protein
MTTIASPLNRIFQFIGDPSAAFHQHDSYSTLVIQTETIERRSSQEDMNQLTHRHATLSNDRFPRQRRAIGSKRSDAEKHERLINRFSRRSLTRVALGL